MVEIVAIGLGLSPDLATYDALRNAVESKAKILVQTSVTVHNQKLIDDTIYQRSAGYVRGFKIRKIGLEGGSYKAEVLVQVDDQDLSRDLAKVRIGAEIDGLRIASQIKERTSKELA